MTTGKAALYGVGSGAWLGILIGLIFGLFTPGPVWLPVLIVSLALGAFWGAVFGFIAHWATKGQRDFSSSKALEAERYTVLVNAQDLGEAMRLTSMPNHA